MPSLLLTVINDDGTVAQRGGKPLFQAGELAVRIFPGTLNTRLYLIVGGEGVLLAEDDLLAMIARGGQTINKPQRAAALRLIADRLESEVP